MSRIKVYQVSRLRGAIAAAVFAAFTAVGVFMAADRPLVGWALTLLFAGATLVALAGVALGGPRLTLGRKGFEMSSLWKTTRIRWDEIEPPQLGSLQKSQVIAIHYLPGKRGQTVSRALTGMDLAVGRMYGVPLEELCRAMNEFRERFLAARPNSHQAAAAPMAVEDAADDELTALALEEAAQARVVPIAFGAAFLVGLLNVVLRMMLQLEGMFLTLGIAFGVAGLVMLWFIKRLRRAPLPVERRRLLWLYSALVIVPYLGLFALGSMSRGFNPWALVILALHAMAYPAAMQAFLAPKRFAAAAPPRPA